RKLRHNNRINTIYYIRHCRFVFSFGVYGGKIQLDLYSSKRVMQALHELKIAVFWLSSAIEPFYF
ncbi:hypothetical protein, partial [Aliivibrio finisterrensis]|uniref:hypothetical protein n=1 Tax=Aliivibrio finisterrensis TaxID=511998 RepID=UPI001A90FA1B